MSVRESVLRLHRWRLQEKQDYLAGLESLRERLRADALRLQDETADSAREYSPVGDNAEPYPLLVRPLIERRSRIERSILEIEVQISEARAAVVAAQQEVKHAENGLGASSGGSPLRVTRRVRRGMAGSSLRRLS